MCGVLFYFIYIILIPQSHIVVIYIILPHFIGN